MREIKFRVRNLNTGKVIGYETLSGGMWFISAKGQDWENGTYTPAEGVKLQREQYTGLKDKNGVEIYEGDVLSGEFGFTYEVRFGFHADTKFHQQVGFYLYDPEEHLNRGSMGFDADEDCPLKVFGDIYENPELLK